MREAQAERRRRRRRRTWRVGVAGVVALGLAGGGVAFAASRGAGERYRTATATQAAVVQTIGAVGTVGVTDRADVAFTVAGTVADVAVAVGDQVAAGDVLATLDPADLQSAVDQAEADLADAEQQLEDDLASQTQVATSTSSGAASSGGTSTGDASTGGAPTGGASTASGGAGTPDPALSRAVAAVQRAQADLLAQDDAVTAALTTSRAALTAADAACDLDLGGGGSTQPTPDPTPDPTADPTAEPTTGPTTEPTATPTATPTVEQLQACRTALAAVQADQDAVDAAQARLVELATALDAAVAEAQRAVAAASTGTAATPAPATPTTSTTPTTTTPSATATSGATSPGGSSGDTTASAADVLADKAAIALAQAQVDVARARLGMTTLTSPVAGTVGAVGMATGDAVTASSTTAVVTVLGATGHMVTTTLGLAVIDTVAVGQEASVTVGSTDEVLHGAVSSIGVLDVSDGSTPEYTVVVTLDGTDAPLFEGASAQVTITVAGDDATLTVPTSAVHVADGGATVSVLRGGVPTDVAVEVGAIGAELTEIRSGLADGDEVVLADLRQSMDDEVTDAGLTGLGETSGSSVRTGGQQPMGVPPGG